MGYSAVDGSANRCAILKRAARNLYCHLLPFLGDVEGQNLLSADCRVRIASRLLNAVDVY
jgi:hypothetical protein